MRNPHVHAFNLFVSVDVVDDDQGLDSFKVLGILDTASLSRVKRIVVKDLLTVNNLKKKV